MYRGAQFMNPGCMNTTDLQWQEWLTEDNVGWMNHKNDTTVLQNIQDHSQGLPHCDNPKL